jgi:15-cis-phytoene synthase
MSGGVDSAVAAARAVEAGHDVVGVHLALSRNPGTLRTGSRGCCTIEDSMDAQRAANIIGIPYYVWDFSERFKLDVVDDFIAEYAAGLYGEPMDSVAALESYTEATCSNLLRLAAIILDGAEAAASRDAALHAGIAYGVTGLLRALPWHCARGQVFVPAGILLAQGANRDDFAAGRASPEVLAALADLRFLARAHNNIFYAGLSGLPEKSRPAFLPVCLCEPYLRLMEKPGYEPFKTVIELPQWRRQWILWRAARRWG